MTTVISYVRFSSDIQAKGESLKRQKELGEKWAKDKGLIISESFKDEGISAYKGKNAKTGALSSFLKFVNDGTIPSGSILLVESLDRLSREDVTDALTQFLNIINSGIKVVTLFDNKEYEKSTLSLPDLMYSLMIMSRAFEESQTKGKRSKDNWDRKRKDNSKLATRMMPAWIHPVTNKEMVKEWVLENGYILSDTGLTYSKPTDIITLRTIFDKFIAGTGYGLLARYLNQIGYKCFGRSKVWNSWYVANVLKDKAVTGRWIQKTKKDGIKVTIGESEGYYPRIISDELYEKVQNIFSTKNKYPRGPKSNYINLYSGLLFDENDRAYTVFEKKSAFQKKNGTYRCLVAMDALIGLKAKQINLRMEIFDYLIFNAILAKSENVLIKPTKASSKLEDIRSNLKNVSTKIEQINEAILNTSGSIPSLIKTLVKLEEDRKNQEKLLNEQLSQDSLKDSSAIADSLQTFVMLTKGNLTDFFERQRLHVSLQRIIKKINLIMKKKGKIIHGKIFIECHSGNEIQIDFTFNPYSNNRKNNILNRLNYSLI